MILNTGSGGGSSMGVVRHIQRGVADISSSLKILLSGFTDVEKMSVNLFGTVGAKSYSSGGYSILPYVNTLTTDSLTVSHGSLGASTKQNISYEIIEYY